MSRQNPDPPFLDPEDSDAGSLSSATPEHKSSEGTGRHLDLLGRRILIRCTSEYDDSEEWDFEDDIELVSTSRDALASLQSEVDHSPSTRAWMDLRKPETDKATGIIDQIIARTGIEHAKQHVLSVCQSHRPGNEEEPASPPLPVAFIGNSGKGQ